MNGCGSRRWWVVGALVLGMSGCAAPKPVAVKVVDVVPISPAAQVAPLVGDTKFESRSLGCAITAPAGWEKHETSGTDSGGTIAFVAPPRATDALEGAPRGTVGVSVQPLAPADAAAPETFARWYLKGFRKRWPNVTVVSQSSLVVHGRPAVELVLTKPEVDPQGRPFTMKILGVFFVQGPRGYLLYYNHEISRFDDHLAARQRMLDSLSLDVRP